ncbi:MAG: amidohydrolase [Sphingomonadales bacterium]
MGLQLREMMAAVAVALCLSASPGQAISGQSLGDEISKRSETVEHKVIAWRRDIHAHPELSNREFRTGALVAGHLRNLGLDDVRINVAHTGVVATLKGGLPGPTVALRADMDALPVTEMVDLPFASHVQTTYNNRNVGVMHACGHDTHTAMLMGVAEVLAGMRDRIPGTVMFIFQPAEEGAPRGEKGGASLMIEEGVLDGPEAPEAIFGLHVWPGPPGQISYRAKGAMAASDWLRIKVTGRQTHGSSPWRGIDPIVIAGQIMTSLQTIPSRQLDITVAPAVVTIGSIHGGVRGNIIPDDVEMIGTIRTFDREMREDLHQRIRRTAEKIAESAGATAEVTIEGYAPVTFNDPVLTRKLLPALERAAGNDKVVVSPPVMAAEDFAFYQEHIPGFYVFLGINKPDVPADQAAPNHSPYFYVNEDALIVGVRTMANLALQYLSGD